MIRVMIDLAGAGFGVMIAMMLYMTFWEAKKMKRSLKITGFVLFAVINTVANELFSGSFVLIGIALLTVFLLSFYFVSSIPSKVFLSFLASAILFSQELLVGIFSVILPGITVAEMQSDTIRYALGSLVSYLTALLIVYAARVFFGREKLMADRQSNLLMALMPLQSIIICLIVSGIISGDEILESATLGIVAVATSLLLVFVTMFILHRQRKAMTYKKQFEISQRRLETQVEHYQQLKQAQDEVRMIRHNMNNNLIAISGMIREGQAEASLERIKGILDYVAKTANIVNTGHPPLDAVLTAKINRAGEAGIQIDHIVALGKEIDIDQFDLSMIIASALDNAIEGIMRSSDVFKTIILKISSDNDYVDIIVVNFSTGEMREDYRTTKPDKSNHGFGLPHMRAIASKYDGVIEPHYDAENSKFTLNVTLRNMKV